MQDNRVFIFDIFNGRIYPMFDVDARYRVDCAIAITSACTDSEYMRELRNKLPGFLDSVGKSPIALAVYNAGTDVFAGDPLGGLNISSSTIRERDLFVVGELRKRGIPTVMVLSGGYTKESYQLVAASVIGLIEMETSTWTPT
jgi:histone deacetylase 11